MSTTFGIRCLSDRLLHSVGYTKQGSWSGPNSP